MDYKLERNRTSFQPLATPGAITAFYAYEGGAARNAALLALALRLAGCGAGTDSAAPVLIIDWDLEAPALHRHLAPGDDGIDATDGALETADNALQAGLLEFFEGCRAELRGVAKVPGLAADELAERILDRAGWQDYIERADGRRPLYLMRAGSFDDSYAERAGRFDWNALFDACPALFRRFAARLARHFRHVLIATGCGRSAGVSVCTTLMPDRLVGLFTPVPGSIDGVEGVVRRAIEYRCTHEDEQRPLLVYPLACSIDGARSDPLARWRRGDARSGVPGYQPRLEALLRTSYGWPRVNLDSYFDEVQLALADVLAVSAQGGDRRALGRFAAQLADWLAPGHLPWQSLEEIRLRAALTQARAAAQDAEPATHLLADVLARLGTLCRRERRRAEARACFEESLALREHLYGLDHAATRAARAALAGLLFDAGALHDARRQYDSLVQACARQAGVDDPETLAARSQLARALAGLGESERALVLHEQVVAACERALGVDHLVTLNCLEDLAQSLVQQREFTRARIVYERVLESRRRQQGIAHQDTLYCAQRLALLLGEAGDLGNARRMLESVLRARERHDGPDAPSTVGAREALAEILAAQGDLAAVRSIQESLAHARERHLGAEHPDTLNMQLRLASTLGQQGEAEAAHRLRKQVAQLRQRLQEAQGWNAPDVDSAAEPDQAGPAQAGADGMAPAASAMAELHSPLPDQGASGVHGREGMASLHGLDNLTHAVDNLGHKLEQLQDLIDKRSPGKARALADSLRTSVLRPSAGHPLRRRGAAMIKRVYLEEGDKDALLSFTQDEVSLLEGALIEAARDYPRALR